MTEKKKWTKVIDYIYDYTTPSNWLIRGLDGLVTQNKLTLSEKNHIEDVWKDVMHMFGVDIEYETDPDTEEVTPVLVMDYDLSVWKELDIFVSSFKPIGSHAYIHKLLYDFNRYMEAFRLLLTDDGFAKTFVRQSSGLVTSKGESASKDYFSETPQEVGEEDTSLEHLQNLSNASHNYLNSKSNGTSTEKVEETTLNWEEKRKNMELVYFRDICYYLMKIPYKFYDFYALDEYPVTYSVKQFYEHVKRSLDFYE